MFQRALALTIAGLGPILVAECVRRLTNGIVWQQGPCWTMGEWAGLILGTALAVGTGSLSAWVLGPTCGFLVGILDIYGAYCLTACVGLRQEAALMIPIWGPAFALLIAVFCRTPWRESGRILAGVMSADVLVRWMGTRLSGSDLDSAACYSLLGVIVVLLATRTAADRARQAPAKVAVCHAVVLALAAALVCNTALGHCRWYHDLGPAPNPARPNFDLRLMGPCVYGFISEDQLAGLIHREFASQGVHTKPDVVSDSDIRYRNLDPTERIGFSIIAGSVEGAYGNERVLRVKAELGPDLLMLQLGLNELGWYFEKYRLPVDGMDDCRSRAAEWGEEHYANSTIAYQVHWRVSEFVEAVRRGDFR